MLKWGESQAQLHERTSDVIECVERPESAGEQTCVVMEAALPAPYTGAGSAGFNFYDGKFYEVLALFSPSQFDDIEASLIDALGKPKQREVGTVQNRMGATFDQATSVWNTGTVSIYLMKRGALTVDKGTFNMTYLPIAKEVPKPAKPVAPF